MANGLRLPIPAGLIPTLGLLAATTSQAQDIAPNPAPPPPAGLVAPASLQWQPVETGYHSEKWEALVQVGTRPNGEPILRKRQFTMLCTGLNYIDEQGTWRRTREQFQLTPDGFAIAQEGPHRLIVGNNANDWVVDFFTGDGVRIRLAPVAIAWFDPVSGQQVILATVRDTAGALTAPQEVTFASAFEGLEASIRISYRRAGMSSVLLLHEAPPDPQLFGLSERAQLELYTELHPQTPQPALQTHVLKAESDGALRAQMAEPDLIDTSLDFAQYKVAAGSAFDFAAPDGQRIPVTKRFITTGDGRRILIEAVGHRESRNLMAALPKAKLENAGVMANNRRAAAVRPNLPARPLDAVRAGAAGPSLALRQIPARQVPQTTPPPIQQAAAVPASKSLPAFLLDYSIITGATNVTLAGGTYFVAGNTYLHGKCVVGPAVVVKYTNSSANPSLRFQGEVEFRSTAWSPFIATSEHDNTVGEALPWSHGAPTNFCGNPALEFNYSASSNLTSLKHARVSHAASAVSFYTGHGHLLRHVQLVHCNLGFQPYYSTVDFQNVLADDVRTLFLGSPGTSTGRVEHLTAYRIDWLNSQTNTTLSVVNSLLVSITNLTPSPGRPTTPTPAAARSSRPQALRISTCRAASPTPVRPTSASGSETSSRPGPFALRRS